MYCCCTNKHIANLLLFAGKKETPRERKGFVLLHKKTILQLSSLLNKIPSESRDILLLFYFEDRSLRDISAQLHTSLNETCNRFAWGLHLLKTQMAKKPKNPV